MYIYSSGKILRDTRTTTEYLIREALKRHQTLCSSNNIYIKIISPQYLINTGMFKTIWTTLVSIHFLFHILNHVFDCYGTVRDIRWNPILWQGVQDRMAFQDVQFSDVFDVLRHLVTWCPQHKYSGIEHVSSISLMSQQWQSRKYMFPKCYPRGSG